MNARPDAHTPGQSRHSRRAATWVCGTTLLLLAAGCGDTPADGTAGADSSTGGGLGSSSSTGEMPTTGDSGATTPTGGVSDSMTGSTTLTTATTTTEGETSGGTSGSSGTTSVPDTTTSGPTVCAEPDLTPGVVVIDAGCKIGQKVGTWMPAIEWQNNTLGNTYTTPAIANLTDDNKDGVIDDGDIPDIVVATAGGAVHVLSGDGKGQHWMAAENMGSEPSSATIADLDADGRPEVVVSGPTGFYAWHGDTGVLMWKNPAASSQPVCGGSSVYDLDGDGTPEVVQGNRIFNGQTGVLRGTGAAGKGTGHGADLAHFGVAADLDQDGDQEVVVGNATYDADGNTLWSTAEHDGFVAIGNFDGDAFGEVVVSWYPGMVRLQEHDGAVIWTVSIGGGTIGAPTVADFDGDGEAEIGVAGQNIYVVLDGDGTTLWSKAIADGSGFTGSSVFDFEGDGKAEVVYADEQDLWVFDGATGAVKLQDSSHSSATCSEYPSIADVDNDGHAEIVYTNSTGVTVVGDQGNSWRRARTTWNQHSYHITNVEGPAGEIPVQQATNWLTFNNFRSASTSGSATDAVPVIVDVCDNECVDNLQLTLQVGNAGTAELPAGVHTSIYGLQLDNSWKLLVTLTTDAAVAPGSTSTGFVVDLAPLDFLGGKLRVVVDDDNGVDLFDECHEDNNTIEIGEGLCLVRAPG